MTVFDPRLSLEESPYTPRENTGGWLGWAVYLGMSWTWCIGMFLPVLLVRDYGIWAWVIFAIPNVVGAAAMGWVLKEYDSQKMVAAHRLAIQFFSFITSTFQIYFAFWFFSRSDIPFAPLAVLAFALVTLYASRRESDVRSIAGVVLTGSLVIILFQTARGFNVLQSSHAPGYSAINLIGLAPVSVFGFLFCPYLDATFHLARQRLGARDARLGFTVGFAIFFFGMIIFSLLYADAVAGGVGQRPMWAAITGHWIIQLGFTAGLHWAGVRQITRLESRFAVWQQVIFSTLLAYIAWRASAWLVRGDMEPGELIYRGFMSFYGLIFPAYVWLCVLPGKGKHIPSAQQWRVLLVTIALASPLFWIGFIERRMLWLLPGMAIVLTARYFIKKSAFSEVKTDA